MILKTTYFTVYVDYNISFAVSENTTDILKALEEIGENLSK